MKLAVLSDNNTLIDRYFFGEPAVSYYIECGDHRILFDTGYSDVYLRNARLLGIDLRSVDTIVLSHAHNDHTGGLGLLPQQENPARLIAHPLVFEPRQCEDMEIGSPLSMDQARKRFELMLSDQPMEIAPNLFFLGEIKRENDFENREPVGFRIHEGHRIPDYLPDDTALAYAGKEGLSIITGCSHAGICNMIAQARSVTGEMRIHSVIGGFHLMEPDSAQLRHTVDFFAANSGAELYPCHCTCFAARAAIHRRVPVREIGSGMILEWE